MFLVYPWLCSFPFEQFYALFHWWGLHYTFLLFKLKPCIYGIDQNWYSTPKLTKLIFLGNWLLWYGICLPNCGYSTLKNVKHAFQVLTYVSKVIFFFLFSDLTWRSVALSKHRPLQWTPDALQPLLPRFWPLLSMSPSPIRLPDLLVSSRVNLKYILS